MENEFDEDDFGLEPAGWDDEEDFEYEDEWSDADEHMLQVYGRRF